MNRNERNKVVLFYNPSSGNGLFTKNLDHIIMRFQQAHIQVIPIRADNTDRIDEFFENLDKEQYQKEYKEVIAAGGDGTINFCVNAMLNHGVELPLAIFPAGTANDFAYYFEIHDNIDDMIDIAIGNNYTYADVGVVNERYFVNVAAIGSVVGVSQKTDPALKNTIGVLAYYLKGLSEVTSLKPVGVKLTTPNGEYLEDMFFMVVMNGKSAGGFKKISPESEINDGLLDVVLFRNMPLFEMPPLLIKVIAGNHPDSKNVLHFQTNELLIEAETDLPTDIDGEKGEKIPLKFKVLHNKLKIMTKLDNLGE